MTTETGSELARTLRDVADNEITTKETDMKPRTQAAYDAIGKAKIKLSVAVAKDYPIGSTISWDNCGDQQSGIVLLQSHSGDRLKVKNIRTGKEYWTSIYNVQ